MSSIRTLLVALYPYKSQGLDSWIDHGAGMTYTAAKKANCNISFLDMKTLKNDDELQSRLKGYDLIAISLKSSYYTIAMKVIKYAKLQGSKVIIGGYHCTAAPNELLENSDIDYVFHGESEITFPKFLNSPEEFNREIFSEKPQDLNSLHFIDRSIYREPLENCKGWWHGGRTKMTSVIATRGCPYKCAFCQPLEDNHFGKKLRRRSVNNVIEELRQLKKLYNPDCLMIHDDTFFIQSEWIKEFIEKYPEINLPFWASARADGICNDPDLVKQLVKVGWELVSVGFESGSQRILDKLKKGTTVEQNIESAKIIKSAGAKIYANYITGIPWETKSDIQATAKMADEINAEMPSWAYFTPYPGCELGEECISKGWSLLNRENYDRCPSGEKVKYVNYVYVKAVREGLREETHPEFCDIIIPSYNNEQFTINCLKSIEKFTHPGSYRVIWVDNASKNSSEVDEVIKNMPHLSIKLSINEGFVGAINKGLAKSTAPNICLLNNDTIVSDRWLEKLINALHKSKEIGIVGPLTSYGVGSAVDSHHSLSLHNSLLPRIATTWSLEQINVELEKGYSGKTSPISFVAFLCAVIKREVIDKVGYLDPNFTIGMYDDTDYNKSIRSFGYKTELALDTCIKHFGRTTFNIVQKEEGLDVEELLKKNKLYLNKKWEDKGSDKTIIISRAIYDTIGDSKGVGILTKHRLEIMQRYFINSLKNQTDKDFILYIFTGKEDNEATLKIKSLDWGDLDVRFIYTNDDIDVWRTSVKKSRNSGVERELGCPEDIVRKYGHPLTNIMIRLDTDDWVVPGWIAHIKYMANTIPETHFALNYQIISQSQSGLLYNFNIPHNVNRISPFLALVQKSHPRISPYAKIHLKMGEFFSSVYTISPSYVYMVVHGENRSNKIYPLDKHIKYVRESGQLDCSIIKQSQGTDWRSRIVNG